MSDFLSAYGVTAGLLSVPCTEVQPFALDRLTLAPPSHP